MNISAPADLEAEILRQRDRLSETVGTLTDRLEDFDVLARAEEVLSRAEAGATELLDRAETGASELIEASTDDNGRPKPAVLIGGAVAAVVVVAILRRRNRAKKAAAAARTNPQGVAA